MATFQVWLEVALVISIRINYFTIANCQEIFFENHAVKGKCECAVFELGKAGVLEKPLLKHTPSDVKCDVSGLNDCVGNCRAVAELVKGEGPVLLCSHFKNLNKFKAGAYAKICNGQKWYHIGLSSPSPVCCENSIVKEC